MFRVPHEVKLGDLGVAKARWEMKFLAHSARKRAGVQRWRESLRPLKGS